MDLESLKTSSPKQTESDSLLDNESLTRVCVSKDSSRMSECLSKFSQIFLQWQQLHYVVTKPQAGKVEEMPLLNDVSGFANPGQILAIMGPSGAGKTTLLNLLCNTVTYDENVKVEGTITANGTNIKDFSFKDYIGYVTQEDILMVTMTCRESLTFAATLKIPVSKDKIKALVDEMLADLKLTHVADSIIGGNLNRGISGGERKRVAIGIELISEPSILFLDEPTSGLDSYTSELVVGLLLDEAKKGRTIITTIHQPSASIFSKFHRLILLMEGNTVYQGSAKESRHYFEKIGYKTPEYVNPADYYMEILNIRSRSNKTYEEKQRLNLFCLSYADSKLKLQDAKSNLYKENIDLPELDKAPIIYRPNWLVQFREILKRSFLNICREYTIIFFIAAIYAFEVVLVCSTVHFLPTDDRGIQTRVGCLFIITCEHFYISLNSVALSCNIYPVPIEKQVFFKEEASGLYSVSAYLVAKNLSLLPQQIIFPGILSCITYWLVGFNPQVGKFLIYCKIHSVLLIILCNITGGGTGLLMGTIFPTTHVAAEASLAFACLLSMFAGIYVSIDDIIKPFDVIQYISVYFM